MKPLLKYSLSYGNYAGERILICCLMKHSTTVTKNVNQNNLQGNNLDVQYRQPGSHLFQFYTNPHLL